MCHSFGDITTSGYLAAILDFRHEVTSAMISGHSDISYVVINTCIVFGTTCVSVKPANLLLFPALWLASWICSTHRRPTKSEVPLRERLTPKTLWYSRWNFDDMLHSFGDITIVHPESTGVPVGILSLCALDLEICLEAFTSPTPLLPANVAKNRYREKG